MLSHHGMAASQFPRDIQLQILKSCGLDAQIAVGIPPAQFALFARFNTDQANVMFRFFKIMNDLLRDVTFHFDNKAGLRVTEMDSAHVCIVDFEISADNLDVFYCHDNLDFAISIKNFFKILKVLPKQSRLTMWITHENHGELWICIDESKNGGGKKSVHKIKSQHVGDNKISLNWQPDYDYNIVMRTKEFEDILKQHHKDFGLVKITAKPKELVFHFGENWSSKTWVPHQTPFGPIVDQDFAITYLWLFTKIKNCSKELTLRVRKDFPIVIDSDIGNIGKIKFALAPAQPR